MPEPSIPPIPWTAEERGAREAAISPGGKIRSSARDLIRFAGWLAVLIALCRGQASTGAGLVLQGWLAYGVLLSILSLGLPQILFGLIPRQDRDSARQTIWLALAFSLAAGLVGGALLLFPALAGSLVGNPALTPLVPGVVLWLVLSLPGMVGEEAVLVRRPPIGSTTLHAGYWAAMAAAAAAWRGQRDPALLIQIFAAIGLARSLAVLAAVQSAYGLWTLRMDWRLARGLGAMAAFFACAAFLETIWRFAAEIVASRAFGAHGLALYIAGAVEWPVAALILNPAFASALPRMEGLLAQGDEGAALHMARSASVRAGRRALFLGFYFLAFGRPWLAVLFGDDYRPSASVMMTLLPLLLLSALSPARLLWAAGLRARSLQGLLIAALLVPILAPILASSPLGLVGPAAAVVVAALTRWLWELGGAAGRFRISARRLIPWQELWVPAAWAGGGAALAGLLVPLLPLGEGARLILGSLGYAAWSALMKWGPLAEREGE